MNFTKDIFQVCLDKLIYFCYQGNVTSEQEGNDEGVGAVVSGGSGSGGIGGSGEGGSGSGDGENSDAGAGGGGSGNPMDFIVSLLLLALAAWKS